MYKHCYDTRGKTLVREVLMNVCTLRRMIVAAGILALSVAAHAQDTKLGGVVTDSTGKPVAGAEVRALLPGPRLVLADEPTGNLDPDNTRRIMDLLFEQAAGATVVMVTHDHSLAARFDTVMDFGELQV